MAIEIHELLHRLERHRGSFPTRLTEEVIVRKDEAIPALLKVLEDVDNNPTLWAEDHERMIHIFAMYFLALFRETSAYPVMLRIFTRPGGSGFAFAGDSIT